MLVAGQSPSAATSDQWRAQVSCASIAEIIASCWAIAFSIPTCISGGLRAEKRLAKTGVVDQHALEAGQQIRVLRHLANLLMKRVVQQGDVVACSP